MNDLIQTWIEFQSELWTGLYETLYMLLISFILSILFGTPIGILLGLSGKGKVYEKRWVAEPFSIVVNIIRSIPFILFMIIMGPFSRMLIGTAYGIYASMISLSVVGVAITSRLVEQAIVDINPQIYDLARSMGATKLQLFFHFLLVESRSSIILGYTSLLISLLAYSTVVGVINGGGLGFLAMDEGFYRWNTNVMFIIIFIYVLLVMVFQFIGSLLSSILNKRGKQR